MKRHVISIGLPKTGTRSLMAALRHLGYTHSGDPFQRRRLEDWCAGNPVFDPTDVQDEPAFAFWELLAAARPDALLIMTVRDRNAWVGSVRRNLRTPLREGPSTRTRRHLEELLTRGRMHRTCELDFLLGLYGGGACFQTSWLEDVHTLHRLMVEKVIGLSDPHRLLVWNLCSAPGWAPLCVALNEPIPVGVPFPHENKR